MRTRQSGATIVEFSLVLMLFLRFSLGILDFSRMLWTWNAANEATRWGARNLSGMRQGCCSGACEHAEIVPQLAASNVQIDWYDAAGNISATCDSTSCAGVNVLITGLDLSMAFPDRIRHPSSHPDAGIFHVPAARNNGAGSQQQCSVQLTHPGTSMKIALISPDDQIAHDMSLMLEGGSPPTAVGTPRRRYQQAAQRRRTGTSGHHHRGGDVPRCQRTGARRVCYFALSADDRHHAVSPTHVGVPD